MGLCVTPHRAARRGAAHSCPGCWRPQPPPSSPPGLLVTLLLAGSLVFTLLMKFRAGMPGLSPRGGLGHERDVALTPLWALEQGSRPKGDSACPRGRGSHTPAEAAASPQTASGLARFPGARPLREARARLGLSVRGEEQPVKAEPASAPCPGSTGCLSHVCCLLPHRDPRPARLSTAALQSTHSEDLGSDSLALV